MIETYLFDFNLLFMKTEVIEGRVIYCFFTVFSAEVNFLSNYNPKGFIVTTNSNEPHEKIANLFHMVQVGDQVKLTLTDGRLTDICFLGLGKTISAKEHPFLGMAMKETAEKKVDAKFVRGSIYSSEQKEILQLCVLNAEKSMYHIESDKSQKARLETFLQKCKKGDVLRLSQNAEGKITHVVNETQAFEFA